MKIAIVAAHFMPEMGYKEVIMANVLARQGHSVNVLTTVRRPSKSKYLIEGNYSLGKSGDIAGPIIWRLQHRWSIGSIVISNAKILRDAISAVAPEIIIVIGVGKLFSNPVLCSVGDRNYGLISFFGDHDDYFPNVGVRQNLINIRVWLMKQLLKNRAVRRAIATSDLIVGYTPDTLRILKRILRRENTDRLLERYLEIPLGFDSNVYHYDERTRIEMRNKLGVKSSEILLLTATRVTPSKKIELAIQAVAALSKLYPIKYYIIGSLGDSYEKEMIDLIESNGVQESVFILPFMSTDLKRAYYCASDIGVWGTAAITIQEAMGTGLFIVLPDKSSVKHLIKEGINGCITDSVQDGLEDAILKVMRMDSEERSSERKRVEEINREFLAYDNIMKYIIDEYLRCSRVRTLLE